MPGIVTLRHWPSREARWQSGHAAACKAVDAGSIPTLASKSAPMAKLVNARDLKSLGRQLPCRFESGSGHQESSTYSLHVTPKCANNVRVWDNLGHSEWQRSKSASDRRAKRRGAFVFVGRTVPG